MPHSLRAKLSGLHYKGILEDKDYKRLCKALDNEKVLEQIRQEIEQKYNDYKMRDDYEEAYGLEEALMIIDRHMKGDSE